VSIQTVPILTACACPWHEPHRVQRWVSHPYVHCAPELQSWSSCRPSIRHSACRAGPNTMRIVSTEEISSVHPGSTVKVPKHTHTYTTCTDVNGKLFSTVSCPDWQSSPDYPDRPRALLLWQTLSSSFKAEEFEQSYDFTARTGHLLVHKDFTSEQASCCTMCCTAM
jgi:hypothetical protein